MISLPKSQGFLSLAAVVVIVILGVMGVAATYMLTTSVTSTSKHANSAQTLFVAQSGLERATRGLLNEDYTVRIMCSSTGLVGTNGSVTSLPGQFTVTGSNSYASSPVILSSAITAGSSSFAVTSGTIANYDATGGRLMIDQEVMTYSAVSGTGFIGVTRGVDGTTASGHSSSSRVAQQQCRLTVVAGDPTVAAPIAQRTLKEGVQMQEGWIVGINGGGSYRIARWNQPSSELTWNETNIAGGGTSAILSGISMASYADGWAVGGAGEFLRWNGTTWVAQTVAPAGTYTSVYCVAGDECWAVGAANVGTPTILGLNNEAGTWTRQTMAASNNNLNGVHCFATNSCWAVGSNAAGGSHFYQKSGAASTWGAVAVALGAAQFPYNGVFCNNTSDCWAVGANGTFARNTGGTWFASATGLPAVQYNGIYCNNATDCWVAGNTNAAHGVLGHYTGTWARASTSGVPNGNLIAVTCTNSSDCWATGANVAGSAVLLHYNGNNPGSVSSQLWSLYANATALTNATFNGIAVLGPSTQPQAAWSETFP